MRASVTAANRERMRGIEEATKNKEIMELLWMLL
jgi:hypothetical protein